MFTFPFERLEVHKRALDFADAIYDLTDKFPREEKYGMVSQARRSAASVAANLAEGSARISAKEQARYSEITYGSLAETFSHLLAAERRNFVEKKDVDSLRPLIFELSNKINALRKSQIKKHFNKIEKDPHKLEEEQIEYETHSSNLPGIAP
jgi:four helix bundle protein